ncbi:hypothetical protein FALBO_3830 [Fusarium albosuccineum]|uniref:Uncharacterized protein n=1 Tax=Fusarium albosuccineum TaxID=1237068 RepID=A0A8H4LH08_9HYPO|nr:hypothetical protein FALBO_3830 [Fusarium albosuccineum]
MATYQKKNSELLSSLAQARMKRRGQMDTVTPENVSQAKPNTVPLDNFVEDSETPTTHLSREPSFTGFNVWFWRHLEALCDGILAVFGIVACIILSLIPGYRISDMRFAKWAFRKDVKEIREAEV